MSVSFYIDENVRSEITDGLRLRDVDVLTVQEDFREGLPDELVLARAEELGRLVFTQDADFLAITSDLQLRRIPFPGVFYSHQMKITIGEAIADLELIAKVGSQRNSPTGWKYLPL